METIKDMTMSDKEIVESYLWFVVKIAKGYTNRGVAFLDLIHAGNCGLSEAISYVCVKHGARFRAYANWHIRQSIERLLANPPPVTHEEEHESNVVEVDFKESDTSNLWIYFP